MRVIQELGVSRLAAGVTAETPSAAVQIIGASDFAKVF
jgi:hypothetical protein